MKVGIVGLGKVGLPLALVLAHTGRHEVWGYDVMPEDVRSRLDHPVAYEQGFENLVRVAHDKVQLVEEPEELLQHADVVLVVVQTPHDEGYGGEVPITKSPRDFDYAYLEGALTNLTRALVNVGRGNITVGVVSTVMPGTIARLQERYPSLYLGYCPALISLGTVIPDLTRADFVLIGSDDANVGYDLEAVFSPVSLAPIHHTSVRSAELLKVSLNAFLSMKIIFSNALMELAHHTGANVDEVTDGLALSDKVTSHAYLRAGLGDGGACRPRDLVALSWLSYEVNAHDDLFVDLLTARQDQSSFLANLASDWAEKLDFEVIVMGQAYKPGLPITDGSAAKLLAWQLGDCATYDPFVDASEMPAQLRDGKPAVYVIATPHDAFTSYPYAEGSVIIDPWRVMPEIDGVTVLGVGGRT